jgi:beta-lactamase superfamily II metal-dependent hydrolase
MRHAVRTSLIAILATMLEVATAQVDSADRLRVYVIDVEGGGATLFVAPSGESLLVDTGNGGAAAPRDAGRIIAAIGDAGLDRIDHLIITHYHGDHIGGLAELASRVPIGHYIDHGPNVQPDGSGAAFLPRYEELSSQAEHSVVRPGDRIDIPGLDIRVVASAARVISTPLPGAGEPNPLCAGVEPIAPDVSENAQSVAISLGFGRFRVAHLGDLTWNGELELMCPMNKFGTADLFLISHHAQQRPASMSNSRPLVHGLRARVAISSNGIRKGAQVAAMEVLFTSPRLEDIWQMHFSQFSGQEYTVPGLFIANRFDGETSVPIAPTEAQSPTPADPPIPAHEGPASYIRVSATADGTFTVTNTRNGFAKTYSARPSG